MCFAITPCRFHLCHLWYALFTIIQHSSVGMQLAKVCTVLYSQQHNRSTVREPFVYVRTLMPDR